MDEFQRRLLDAVQTGDWIASVAKANKTILNIDFYNYNTTIGPVASGATGAATIQIQSDSDFALCYMSGAAVVNNNAINTPYTTLQITDTGTGKTFFSAPTLFQLVFGTNGLPFYLPAPRVVTPNTNLQINLTNVNSAAATTYFINLFGARIYYAN
jgi:hypothetical protein